MLIRIYLFFKFFIKSKKYLLFRFLFNLTILITTLISIIYVLICPTDYESDYVESYVSEPSKEYSDEEIIKLEDDYIEQQEELIDDYIAQQEEEERLLLTEEKIMTEVSMPVYFIDRGYYYHEDFNCQGLENCYNINEIELVETQYYPNLKPCNWCSN